jgi:hypothetical protein
VVGLLWGRARAVVRVAGATFVISLLVAFRAPVLTGLVESLPGFGLAANLRLQSVAVLAVAVLAGQGVDALGRVTRGARERRRLLLAGLVPLLAAYAAQVAGVQLEVIRSVASPPTPQGARTVAAQLLSREQAAGSEAEVRRLLRETGRPAPAEARAWAGLVQLDQPPREARLFYTRSRSAPAVLVRMNQPGTWSFAAMIPERFRLPGWDRMRLSVTMADGTLAMSGLLTPPDVQRSVWSRHPARPATHRTFHHLLGFVVTLVAAALLISMPPAAIAWQQAVPVLLVITTLHGYAEGMLPLMPRRLFFPSSPLLERLTLLPPDGRMLYTRAAGFPPEIPTWYGIPDVLGYDALNPRKVALLLRAAAGRAGEQTPIQKLPTRSDLDLDLLGLMSVRVLVNATLGEPFVENPAFLPRARLVTGARIEPDDERALETLRSPGFARETTVVLASGKARDPQPGQQGQARIVEAKPGRVGVRVEAPSPALLVLSDTWFPGWTATADGERREILRANVAFRAIELEPGEQLVEFRYEPLSVRLGALVSLLTLALLATLAILGRPRPVASPGPPSNR